MENLTWPKLLLLGGICILLFFGYVWVSGEIFASKYYPSGDKIYLLNFGQKNAPSNCFEWDTGLVMIDLKNKRTTIDGNFNKNCDFDFAMPYFTFSDGNINFTSSDNLSFDIKNQTGGYLLLEIQNSSMERAKWYNFEVTVNHGSSFYDRFSMNADGTTGLTRVSFNFDGGFTGYLCESEGCFTITSGTIEDEFPLERGRAKSFIVSGQSFAFRFNPISRMSVYKLEFGGSIVASMIAVFIYELIKFLFNPLNNAWLKFKPWLVKHNKKRIQKKRFKRSRK
ncbi:MAG: hypothetical protein Q7S65_05645 [Nanoarchaeota archaeon]|nr:hypothetical protein [Nanoarchaeota archaeon]